MLPSVQVSWPPVYALRAALVRVNLTVNAGLARRERQLAGVTTTSMPAMPVCDSV